MRESESHSMIGQMYGRHRSKLPLECQKARADDQQCSSHCPQHHIHQAAMAFTLPECTFLPLVLSEHEKQALAQQAQMAVQESIVSSDEFMANGMKIPRPKQWKLVKAKETFYVHRERQSKAEMEVMRFNLDEPGLPEFVDRPTSGLSSVSTITDTIDYLPAILGFGTIDGTLEDAMYGSFTADDESWRLKSSYMNDRLDDAKLLATINWPRAEDPYRFLGVRWFTYELPIGLGAIVQRRDFVVLEATGLTHDSQGNQVGYSLYQSIVIPEIPELKSMKIIRGYISTCFVNRTQTPSTVSIFCRGFLDIGGCVPASLGASLMADSLVTSLDIMESAYMKKLMWMVKQTQKQQLEEARVRANSCSTNCHACKRSVNKLTTFASGSNCRVCLAVRLLHVPPRSINQPIFDSCLCCCR